MDFIKFFMRMSIRIDVKRVVLTVLPVAMAISCTRTLTVSENMSAEPISFSSGVMMKTPVTSVSDMSEFAVWMYLDGDLQMEGEKVYRNLSGEWVYDNVRFWTEGTYNFGAFYPVPDESGRICVTMHNPAQGGDTGIGISYFDGSSATEDLMTAMHDRVYSSVVPDASAVSLSFGHILSQVRINGTSGSNQVSVDNISFSGMGMYGRYNIDNGSGTAYSGVWNLLSETSAGEPAVPGIFTSRNIAVPAGDTTELISGLLLIPQDPSKCRISVNYSIDGEPRSEEIVLPSSPVWSAGGSYRYTLSFNASDITMSITLVDWEERNYSVTF